MSEYRAPIRDMMFVLEELAGLGRVSKLPGFDEVNQELVGQILEENGKFAWIMDPDGNKVELWEPMAWDEKNKK